MNYDVVIIGAGIAGLTAALKLSQAGKKVLLLEAQPIPGGYVTCFQRKGFTFESAIHCVDALGADSDIIEFLKDAGVASGLDFVGLESFSRLIYPEHDFIAGCNQDNFKKILKDNFPQEKINIDRLFCAINAFLGSFDNFYKLRLPYLLKLFLSPFVYPALIKVSQLNTERFIKKYVRDKRLFAILTSIWGFVGLPPERMSAFYFLLVLRGYYFTPTAYIKGGTFKLSMAMAAKIQENGSELRFNAKAEKIVTDKKGAVRSVVTKEGEEFFTRAIISNANPIDTLGGMLDNEKLRQGYNRKLSLLEKSISAIQVYLGLKVPARALGMNHYLFSINPYYDHQQSFNYSLCGDYDKCSLGLVDHAQLDCGLVPQGKGSLIIMTLDAYSNWKDLTDSEYRLKKEKAARQLIERAEKYLPGLSDNIEVMEVATPRTMQRFTLSPEGAIYGFSQTTEQSAMNRLGQKTSVKGLFLAGAWTRPGHGVHACFVSGIGAADLTLQLLRR